MGTKKEPLLLTVVDWAGRKDGLFPLAQTGVNAFVDEQLGQTAVSGEIGVFALTLEFGAGLCQTLFIVLAVVDVADRVPLLRLVDGTKVPGAQQAGLEEFGRGGKVAWVLFVTQVA